MSKKQSQKHRTGISGGDTDIVVEASANMPLIGMRVCDTDRRAGKMGICDFVNKSEATVLDWIRNRDFPARKLGGVWVSTTREVLRFLTEHINGDRQ